MIPKEINDYKKLSSSKTKKEVKSLTHAMKVEMSKQYTNLYKNFLLKTYVRKNISFL